MASKYAALKGKIPGEQTKRDVALLKEIERLEGLKLTPGDLAADFNRVKTTLEAHAEAGKKIAVELEARKLLILHRIDADNSEGFKADGFTWSESFEPYPVCEDPAAAIEYFKTNGMEDLLLLKASEVNSRVENFVKDEALRGELTIEEVEQVDEATGETRTVQVVKSKIPGVKVYLDTKLSRVKSTSKKTATVS